MGGDDGGLFAMPVFDDLRQQHPALDIQELYSEVIEDQHIQFFQIDISLMEGPSALAIFSWVSNRVVLAYRTLPVVLV